MLFIATFENNIFIELAISAIEQEGIVKENIYAAPLDKRKEAKQIFDTLHRADGLSIFDLGAVLGTCFMLLGTIYGYILYWGPIIWGIIGALFGLTLGILIKLWITRHQQAAKNKITSEIIVMIRCDEHQQKDIEKILWDNLAIGLTCIK
ncbi:hypothetical protein FZW96_07480 [Bacillus sp. BGMRC 2118]|nr:hypothetical protein FZW96_07480 [Bacillus sp. BGMRC 2118]